MLPKTSLKGNYVVIALITIRLLKAYVLYIRILLPDHRIYRIFRIAIGTSGFPELPDLSDLSDISGRTFGYSVKQVSFGSSALLRLVKLFCFMVERVLIHFHFRLIKLIKFN